ncbi:MAG: FMN-binding negative transcriptional regulator [Oxalobacteraceae bacterium]
MYLPPHFAETRPEELHRIIREHPLGMLVTQAGGILDANHLPFECDSDQGAQGTLLAHIARANPLWTECRAGAAVMVVFRGVEGYISPNWYPSKHETHRQVPTWNYEVVHVHGRLRIVDDEKFIRGVVARLTREHEATEPRPWKMGDAPKDYMDEMVSKVVGIAVEIDRLEGKRKLSQNRESRDIHHAVSELTRRDQHALATSMSAASPASSASTARDE